MSPPEEVNLQDMQMICRELDHLKNAGDEKRIQVFELGSLERFMAASAEKFCDSYI